MFPAFFNPRWLSAIYRTARRERSELILVRDLPLAPAAIAVARTLGIPVILDMAENYPAMMQSLFDARVQRRWDVLVRNPRAVRAVERWVLRHVDHVLVVVEESRDRLVALGLRDDRITLVGNTPPLQALTATAAHVHRRGELHLTYLGLLEAPRGLGVVIAALARCRARGLQVKLTVIGTGRERARFERQARELGLDDSAVRFLGYVPNEQALRLVGEADVGLVPHMANNSWNTTIPNKLFDYMAAGLAIITSDARPAARIVCETGTGEVFGSGDPDALVSAIERLADPEVRAALGQRGRCAIATRYNWEADEARLLAAVEHSSRTADR
jgi:glycosyltransferase involved in cell wall biosynthesis